MVRASARRRALAALIGVAACLLLVELAVRVAGLAPPQRGAGGDREPLVDWREREHNRRGFHDRPWPRERTAGVARVLMLGDSMLEGTHVPLADLLHTRVEELLDGRAGRDAYEVFNLARRGWDTHAEVDELERIGLRYRPDAVVIVFFVNDATFLDTNPLVVAAMQDELGPRDGLLHRVSRAYDWLHYRYRRRRVADAMIASYRESYFGHADRSKRWRRCIAALERARALADEHRFRLALVVFPALIQLRGEHALADVYAAVEDECARLDIPTLDLLPAFQGHAPESLWVAPDDAHPNAAAYALAAGPVADFLVDAGLVPAPE